MRTLLFLLLIVLAAAALLLGPSAYAFYNAQGPLPGGVTLGGMTPQGETLKDVATALHETFQQPVAAYFDDKRIILHPEDVDFEVDVNAMVAEAVPYGQGIGFWRPFLREVFDQPARPVDVPLKYTLNEDKLAAWLDEVAASHDQAAKPPYGVALAPGTPFTSTFMFQTGEPGLELEKTMSAQRVVQALASHTDREAKLVLVEVPPPPPSVKELEKLLAARAEQFPGTVSIFIRQAGANDEVAIEPEIAFAGMSTMKIPIMMELYRSVIDGQPDVETTKLLTETLGLSGNFTANLLLRLVGGGAIGNEWQGADKVTQTLRSLGLQNTFMATPYDTEALPRTFSTPANSRTDYSTLPDQHMQTTAKDIALILEWIVQCSEGRGTLLAAYPEQLTADECKQMIDFMDLNKKNILLETGLPKGVHFVHKHGFVDDSHGDVAAVWSPAGPYVVSVFIWKNGWVEWPLSSGLMADVSKAAWDYFTLVANGGQPPQVKPKPAIEAMVESTSTLTSTQATDSP